MAADGQPTTGFLRSHLMLVAALHRHAAELASHGGCGHSVVRGIRLGQVEGASGCEETGAGAFDVGGVGDILVVGEDFSTAA
ncbi:hypothetical protein [Streptomyces griseorubiginosus]|uniref:hypothetical protein n=1 Tax=Streptomyces griseorubiginosus TaxID=67304 RepID=UPI0036E8B498